MKFTCDRCNAQYMISDEKVGPSGVKVRCKKCSNVIVVRRAADVPAEPAPAPAAAPQEPAPSGGLDAELGSAFDHAFGDAPAAAPAAAEAGADAAEPGSAQAPQVDEQPGAAPEPAPPATEWYVAIGQAQVGPLPLTEVKRKWEAGDVGPDSLVWRPGMGDWQPLSSQADLAAYLAPVPRGTPQPSRAEAPVRRATPQPVPAAAPAEPAADVTWKPVGASALAALASEEIAARAPEPKPEPKAPAAGVKSLVEGLPDGGGVDPTGAIPLPIKGLEVTGEKKLERRSTIASHAEETRHKRSVNRIVIAAVAGIVVVGGAAAAWFFTQKPAAPKVAVAPPPPAPVQAAPVAPAPPPAVAPAVPAGAPPTAAAPPAPVAPAAAAPAPVAPPPAPAVAKAPPAEPAAPPPHKLTKKEKAQLARAAKAARRDAAPKVAGAPAADAPPAPAPAPARRKKDALLDFDSNDNALDEALGGGSSKRSVYVPPAPAGGGALPDKLTAAQINESVAGRIDSLRRCVSEQKARDPSASGVLRMKWVIAGDGSVRDVRPLPGEYASGPFSGCITGVVKGIRFPRSATTGQEVTFPFSF